MKGIVLEIRNRTAAVLREDGVIVKTRQKCAVGDTIELPAEKIGFPSARNMRSIAAAAAAVIVIGGGSGIYTYENVMACSYVSLDVNPSLELVLNRQNRVIKVNACDEEAESVVEAIKEQNIKNMKVDDALETAYEVLKENGYITEDDENYLLFNVSSDEKSRTETLTDKIETMFGAKEGALAVTTESSLDDRNNARELGISTGKYHEIRMIEESMNPDSVNIDAQTVGRYSDMTVRECMEEAGQIPRNETAEDPTGAAAAVQPAKEIPENGGNAQQPAAGAPSNNGLTQPAAENPNNSGLTQGGANSAQQTDGRIQEGANSAQQTDGRTQEGADSSQLTGGVTQEGTNSSQLTEGRTQESANPSQQTGNMQQNPAALQSAGNTQAGQNTPAAAQNGMGAPAGGGTAPAQGNPGAAAAASPQQPGGPK